MTIQRSIVLAVLVICFISCFASANSIPISGGAVQGQPGGNCCFNGDFLITGPGLSLFQGTPDGPNEIGVCAVDAVCNFSFSIGSAATFCSFCLGLSGGSVGNKIAEFLDPSLTFTGSALYSGEASISVPMTVSGTIVGYELLNCDSSGSGCTLGPKEFTLHIVAHGTGVFTMNPGGSHALMYGVSSSFTGTATTVPEPISLVLTGTGLLGILIRKKVMRRQV
jgi:hypothetical protein